MKVCTKCKCDRDESEFRKGRGRLGLHVWCKPCEMEYNRSPKAREAKRRHAMKDHRENRAEKLAYKAKYRASVKGRALQLRDNAKVRAERLGVPFDLTREWLEGKLAGSCELTGRCFDLSIPPAGVRANPNAPSLDRLDSRGGYVVGNVRVVTVHANVARNEFSDAELLSLAHDIIRTISSQASQEEGSTAIPEGSSVQASAKRLTPARGDDMVCSA